MELLSLFLLFCFAWGLYIWSCVICWQKGRKVYFWLGLILGLPTNIIGALRLGKPGLRVRRAELRLGEDGPSARPFRLRG